MKMNMRGIVLTVGIGLTLAGQGGYYVETNETERLYTVFADSTAVIVKEAFADLDGQPWKLTTAPLEGSDRVFNFLPETPSTFSGGLMVTGGQVRVTANGVGTGPITLTLGASLVGCDVATAPTLVDLTNVVEFGSQSTYATSPSGSRTLRLHALRTGALNAAGEVRLGRTYEGGCSVQLALDGAENEPINDFGLQMALALTLDGGTVRIADGAKGAIFRSVYPANTPPTLSMTAATTTFEIGTNAEVLIGMPLAMVSTTNLVVLEAVTTADYGFETGMGPWKGGYLPSATVSDSNTATRQKNGSAFIPSGYPAYYTTNGNWAVMLRRQSYLQASITVPHEDDWCVVFDCGCRADGDGKYSKNIPISVLVDGETVTEFPPAGVLFTFKRFATAPVHLAAGAHTVRIETGMTTQDYDCILFDCIRLERTEDVAARSTLCKRGAGTLTLDTVSPSGAYRAEEGTLKIALPATEGARLSAGSGGTLFLGNAAESNLVVNGSFEKNATGKDLTYTAIPDWTKGRTQETTYNTHGPGVQGNGGNVSPEGLGPMTPVGTHAAALRVFTYIEQTVTVPEDGLYCLTYLQSCRRNPGYLASCEMVVQASVGGTVLAEVGPFAAPYDYLRTSARVSLKAGPQTVRFEAVSGGTVEGLLAYIDDVRLVRAQDETTVYLTADFEPGAELWADFVSPIRLMGLTVGGEEVRSRRDLKNRGVRLTGLGNAKIGERTGVILLVR